MSTATLSRGALMKRSLPPESFFGRKLRGCEIDGFRFSEWSYAPGVYLSWHTHESAFFNIILEGTYTKTEARRTWSLSPFALTFHPAGERHADTFHQAGGRIFDVEIDDSWLKRTGGYGRVLADPIQITGGLPVWL